MIGYLFELEIVVSLHKTGFEAENQLFGGDGGFCPIAY
jgi:hypothetical protein